MGIECTYLELSDIVQISIAVCIAAVLITYIYCMMHDD